MFFNFIFCALQCKFIELTSSNSDNYVSLSVTSPYPVISGSFKVMTLKRKFLFLLVLCVIALLSLSYVHLKKINGKHNLRLSFLPTIFFLPGLNYFFKFDMIKQKNIQCMF